MKLILMAAFAAMLSGCAYNSITIYAEGDVRCNGTVEKPVAVDALRGLLQGSTNDVPVSLVPK